MGDNDTPVGGDSVELGSIPANVLRQMVEACITRHIDQAELDRIKRIEAAERDTLSCVRAGLRK